MLINVITETLDYAEPTQEDLAGWAGEHGLTLPVVADPAWGVTYTYATGSIGLPFMVLLDRGAVVEKTGSVSTADIDALLE